jgi:hypothetical protein
MTILRPSHRLVLIALIAAMLTSGGARSEPGRYLTHRVFLQGVFGDVPEQPASLLVDADLRVVIEAVLDHRFGHLRVRYWDDGQTTAWVLDEVGKTEPITVGIAIRDTKVLTLRVLEFRESRGWEVRYPFFTDQFSGVRLTDQHRIDRAIDGITGATLSVAAVQKVARVALILDAQVRRAGSTPAH